MPEATPVQPASPEASSGARPIAAGRPQIVRLPTWVNVVLVLTLLASCSAAGRAGDAVNQVINGPESAATGPELRDVCRLLGAVAAEQGMDLDATFAGGDADTICEAAAREAGTP